MSVFSRLAARSAALGLGLGIAFGAVAPAVAATDIKMVLNWKYQGPQAWFFMAQDKGYFKDEGLNVTIDQGEGSAASVIKVASGAYDAGFGDVNALIDMAAKRPESAPVAVYMMYNTPPFVIAVKADSPIKTPKDLEGRTVGGPANDAALKLFPVFAKTAGVDAGAVKISNMAPNLREQMLLRDQVDAVFGYINTVAFSARLVGLDPDKDLRFIKYGDHGMDLYSNTIVFSRKFVQEHPEAVSGLLRAVNRALNETVADPDAAMDYVMKREPLLNREIEKERLLATLQVEMNHPEIKTIGFGDVDPERLKRTIAVGVQANELPRTPEPGEIFDNRFLPARDQRASSL
ncbi:ABC transporter substrate-binding protein [Verticiella sediminum]|uniref:ABC transporter substrate-binding protein n=1 Tax=Verticiella sediminum TaxID=1247510 RepID=A0A556A9A3_9BURK|nr:ABC transporter substrate-binding protein [Verticiella sediminum]TSH89459.1 ABC transporter substrate-binding protein [Verticiella sediminum]